ncbi:Crp/Fnr family transcriptional regulator [Mucilaginibacter sp. AW1-7]|jgi:CRP-like cAMP-binding protein|uniref:Crp/Fnr family transcriptional regulator n=1 Tax=Mucilaginibacter sp. AW1-7 TaxID=3349874 RepID=UPI003F7368DC
MHQFRTYFEKYFPIADNDWEIFSKKLTRKELPKRSLLLKEGQVENRISFIEKGIVRFFIRQSLDKEITFAIIFENELMCCYDSFLTRQPAEYNAETITETIIWSFSYDDLQQLYATMPVSNVLGRILSEEIYLIKAKRELSALKYQAKERYLNLFKEKPRLVKEIPLKFLASYIGITPQALSRIRKQIY